MDRRILATVLSILLVAGLLLSRPTTAKADSWQETIDRYDELFAPTDDLSENKFNTLYTVLQSEPGTFLNQLAFRDRDTKEYVLSILTGDWVSDESLQTMSALVSPMQFMQELTDSEKELSEDLQYHLNYTYHSRPREHRDLETLFAQCLSIPTSELESFSLEVKYAFMQDPRNFIVKLAQEELSVRNGIAADLLLHFEDTIPTLIVLDLLLLELDTAQKNPGYYTDEEIALLETAIGNTLLTPDPHSLSAPYTQELSLWLKQQEKANSWSATIEQYDHLFRYYGNYERLYTSLILEPETFVNQLAFRDAETKEKVMYYLTGSWITPEQMKNMTQVVTDMLSLDLDSTTSETQLLNAMYEHFMCADSQYLGIATDCKALMEWVKTADPAGAYDLSLELARALIGTPEAFLLQLASEEESVQNRVIELLQIHNATYLATTIVNCVSNSEASIDPKAADLVLKIYTSLGCKGAPLFSDPDPEEYEKWLTEAPLTPSIYVDYERLFAVLDSKGLANALLDDTRNFVKNLAYQDAETKQKIFNILSNYFEDRVLIKMYLCLQQHQESTVLNKSQTALVEALMYQLDYAYCCWEQPHRDISVLFHEAQTGESTMPARHDAFCRELKFAFLEDPYSFIVRLATEDEFVQSYVVQCLMSVNSNNDALIRRVYSKWIQEENADYYTEEQLEQIRQVTVSYLPILGEAPKPSDPDPEEYEDWLAMHEPIYGPGVPPLTSSPEKESTQAPTAEETQPAAVEEPEKGGSWISTVCFTLGCLCLGIATGSIIAKRKKAKTKKEAEEQAPSPIPFVPQPKLLYCPMPLSRDIQKQVTLALREKYDEYSVHWYSIKQTDGTCRCYGTDSGYDIIFYAGGLRMEIPDSYTVGEYTFLFETSFELYAHKDGNLTDLNTALEQGLVSQQAVQEALEKHNSISQ